MQSELAWDEILKRTDLIGGDIESIEDGIVFRGPISAIREEGGQIIFESEWCAFMDPAGNAEWENWDTTSSSVNKKLVSPSDIGEGRVSFYVMMIGNTTLFPAGGSKLDPAKVKGLDRKFVTG